MNEAGCVSGIVTVCWLGAMMFKLRNVPGGGENAQKVLACNCQVQDEMGDYRPVQKALSQTCPLKLTSVSVLGKTAISPVSSFLQNLG
jgi:hypothetical protein